MRTVEEWSQEFDLLYNNIASNKAPGLEEYEKSVFLTRAQLAVVTALYNGTLGNSFESTEAMSVYLAPLVKQAKYEDTDAVSDHPTLDARSIVFQMPDDLLFRTYESCKMKKGNCISDAVVVPTTQDEYWRTVNNPFKGSNHRRVLRLTYSEPVSQDTSDDTPVPMVHTYSELIQPLDYSVDEYSVRYLSRPKPIILVDLETGGYPYIDGESAPQICLLDEAIHHTILTEAVNMAKEVWKA